MIPVFLTIDDKYAHCAATAIASLIDHASRDNEYVINVVYRDLTGVNEAKLKSLQTANCRLNFIRMDDILDGLEDAYNHRLNAGVFAVAIYFRLFIAKMFPQYDKGIYIDSDVILNEDIAKLYGVDLEGNLIGAARDVSVCEDEILANYIEQVVGINRYEYVNSGVLLLDMNKLREVGFAERFLELLRKYDFNTVAPDQDYINAILKGRIKFLDEKWDVMPMSGKVVARPALIHYNLFYKPWHYGEVQYGEYFWKYAEKSPFRAEIEAELAAFGEDGMARDEDCFNLMKEMALEAIKGEVTFRKVFESGSEERI